MSGIKAIKDPMLVKRRKHIRFNPDLSTIAFIDLDIVGENFEPKISAIVLNQSYKGVALATRTNPDLKKGVSCYVKVGQLAPLRGEIVWIEENDPEVMKLGVNFLE